jgi:tRNA uracil 4-sulfurtransferase
VITENDSDMDTMYLIKTGEIKLKEGNKDLFESILKVDIKRRLSGLHSVLHAREGRYYLLISSQHAEKAEYVLSRMPGINAWADAYRVPKDMPRIEKAAYIALEPSLASGAKSFKVEARRSDKSFPLDSYAIARNLGGSILERFPQLQVDVHAPDTTVNVEIREKAYVYCDGNVGVRGLPVGSGGKGLLLLSGGIDSPVAGFRMLCRGLALESLHFTSYPYTSREAWEKVRDLATILATYSGGMTLHTVNLTDIQLRIKKDAVPEKSTLYLRACMMIAADHLARKRSLKAIVTGESLGQVASQTAENMRFTGSFTDFPVLRPLVGTDKEETITIARSLGTYGISILPYDDCCVLFSSKHPVLKAEFEAERHAFERLGLREAVVESIENVETTYLPFSFMPPRVPGAHRR